MSEPSREKPGTLAKGPKVRKPEAHQEEEKPDSGLLEASRRGSPGLRLAAWIAALVFLMALLGWALSR